MPSLPDDRVSGTNRLGMKVERVWLWKDQFHYTQVSTKRPDSKVHPEATEYMRVMSRQEVEKIAGDGVDVQQYLNSLLRTIEGQRIEINRLNALVNGLHRIAAENMQAVGDMRAEEAKGHG